MSNITNNFCINGSMSFNGRLKSTFDVLDNFVPNSVKTFRYTEDEFLNSKPKLSVINFKKEVKQFRGQESIFKKPEMPKRHPFKIKLPDYIKNPHKWKKYDLGDYIITDKSNRDVAMKFLIELQTRKDAVKIEDVVKGPIKFNPHINSPEKCLAAPVEQKSEFRDSKVIMPEYVIGQKPKKSCMKRKPVIKEESKSNVKLHHLLQDDSEIF